VELCEHEVILRIADDEDAWHVYVTRHARGGGRWIRLGTIIREDAHGTWLTIPRALLAFRLRTKHTLSPEQRAEMSVRFESIRIRQGSLSAPAHEVVDPLVPGVGGQRDMLLGDLLAVEDSVEKGIL
jgi:hypothetical protein